MTVTLKNPENTPPRKMEHTHEREPTEHEIYLVPKEIASKAVGRYPAHEGTSIVRDKDGKRLTVIVTSNAYEDRDGETFTTDALKQYVDSLWLAEDNVFHSDNPHLFWHDDRLKMGDIVYSNVHGAFLVEVAKEADTPIARALLDYIEKSDERWGASQRFVYTDAERDADGTFHALRKRETSTLPREASANQLTYSGVMNMGKREDYLNKMFGIENASALLDEGVEKLEQALQAKGIGHKSLDDPTPIEKSYAQVLSVLLDNQMEQADRLERAETVYASKEAGMKAEMDAFTTKSVEVVNKLATQVKELTDMMSARPKQASKSEQTLIAEEEIPATVKDSMKPRDSFWEALNNLK